ncbi:MAG: chemotaxis protein CheW [Acidimicrobiia bacterium]|nr:chemotaxis protein CheW [Acidimicrobiia bacterium]
MGVERQYCTFTLDGQNFGVEVRKVQEVLRYQDMTAVPLAPSVVSGLINLRGQIVTAVDLRRRLVLPERRDGRHPMNIVVRTDDGALSLLVDSIGEVLLVDTETFEAPPETIAPQVRELLTGVCKLEDRLLLILDIDKAVDVGASGADAREPAYAG